MIFYVEDDFEIKNLILYTLKASGFDALGFSNSKELYEELKIERPELIMLDIMLQGDDGLTILKKLRQDKNYKDIPIIMSTAKGSEYDKVVGLESGADDYLVKPFGMMEMIARIKALLRRTKSNEEEHLLKNGNIVVDNSRHIVFVDNNQIQLTLKEYELLCLFLKRKEHVFSREYLLEYIWGMDYLGETRTVDVHIGTLRTKLGRQGELIQTVRGVGYKMVQEDEKKNI